MTTLELFKKHRKGEVSRERFLYEVRRDNNLPWVTNTTSYDDAVKILKNKGIIREAQFEPQNIATAPEVDRVNPYALKREVEKLLAKEPELTNDSYKEALNKAAKKLTTPAAVKKAMFANADTVEKADAKLQMTPVKKANHVDKANGMKKMKGQQMPKATAASTKENKKTKKPKGVEIMPDKGVEGREKIIKESLISELTSYLKKKLNLAENSPYHDRHVGEQVPTPHGEGVIKEINGGTLCVEVGGKLYDVQMNVVQKLKEKEKEEPQHEYESGFNQLEEEDSEELKVGDKVEVVYGNQYQGQIVTVKDIENGFIEVEVGTLVTKEELEGEDVDSLDIGDNVMYDDQEVKVLDFDDEGNPYLNLGQTASMHISDVKKIENDNFGYDDEELEEAGEKTAIVTTTSGEKTAVDYKTDDELKSIGDNADVRALKTGTGRKVKE